MTKAELIERIARSRDLPADTTKKCIAEILEIAFDELAVYFARARVTRSQSPRFTYPGFGTFTKKKRSARRGINPRTLEPMQIEASFTLDFKAGMVLREAMNPQRSPTKQTVAEDRGQQRKPAPGRRRRKAKRASKRRTGAAGGVTAPKTVGGRKLTPRDDDAKLDELLEDEPVFDEHGDALPEPPLARVSSGQTSKRRRTG